MAAAKPETALAAVERDLKAFGARVPATLAATAREMARQLDDPTNSATSKSMCAKALTETMDKLRELAPPKQEADRLDELSDRRAKRKRGSAA